jgi:hypothetical protein
MTLTEFLKTASDDHGVALAEARAYSKPLPVLLNSNVLTVHIVGAGLYGAITDQSQNPASPVRDICLALMDRLRSQSEFNLMTDTPMGAANVSMLNAMIASLPEYADKLSALRDTLIALSTRSEQPFKNATLHDVLVARNACPAMPVEALNGWVTVVTSGDTEQHNPRLMALNNRTKKWQRINSFPAVAEAGAYETQVPREWIGSLLAVDDAYGVM